MSKDIYVFNNNKCNNEQIFDEIIEINNIYCYKMNTILFCYLNVVDRNLSYFDDKEYFEKLNFHDKVVGEKNFFYGKEKWKGIRKISKVINESQGGKIFYIHHLILEGPWQNDIDFPEQNGLLSKTILNYFSKNEILVKIKCYKVGKGFKIKAKSNKLSTIFIIEIKSNVITNTFNFYFEKGKNILNYYSHMLWEKLILKK